MIQKIIKITNFLKKIFNYKLFGFSLYAVVKTPLR